MPPADYLANVALQGLLHCSFEQIDHSGKELIVPRLASWVEAKDSKLGYALAISRLENSKTPELRARFFVIDREHQQLSGQPKDLHVVLSEDVKEIQPQLESVENEFDSTELEAVIHILAKISNFTQRTDAVEDSSGLIDRDVAMALLDSNLDLLAESYPAQNHSIIDFLKSEAFIAAAKDRLTASYTGPEYEAEVAVKSTLSNGDILVIQYSEGMAEPQVTIFKQGAKGSDQMFCLWYTDLGEELDIAGDELGWDAEELFQIIKTGVVMDTKEFIEFEREALTDRDEERATFHDYNGRRRNYEQPDY